jgi:CRISPR-associated protein Cst2
MTSGNHPFSHIVKSENKEKSNAVLNLEGIKEILKDYKDQFQGLIFIGKRSGFMDEHDDDLKGLKNEFPNVEVSSINEAIDKYCEQIKTQIP